MAGPKGRLPGLFDEEIVYAALDAIDQALEQALSARTETQQRWQLNQLRGLLLTLPSSGLSLEDSLRQLIRSCGPRCSTGNPAGAVPWEDGLLEGEGILLSAPV